jgi:hypothetical protein
LAIINNKKKIMTNGMNIYEVDNFALIKDLVLIGTDLNLTNNDKDTILHLICKNNHDTTNNSYQIKIELLRLLKPTMQQLSEALNIYDKSPIDCWIGFKNFQSVVVSFFISRIFLNKNMIICIIYSLRVC